MFGLFGKREVIDPATAEWLLALFDWARRHLVESPNIVNAGTLPTCGIFGLFRVCSDACCESIS